MLEFEFNPNFVPAKVTLGPRMIMVLLSMAWDPIGRPAFVFSIIYL